ncbi:MAG: aminotransferase class III-fold pyridoxal phosphate-dependent enzyme, partial [Oceanicoccus sp.]
GKFPGADSIDEFWSILSAGKETISRFSVEELLADGVPADLANDPNYVRARGLIKSPEYFDAAFFGMTPREAELTDPQQRLFLENCWRALDDAGYAASQYEGSIGVWGGMSTGMTNNTYLMSNLHAVPGTVDREDMLPVMLGNENDYLTTRVSYKLNLRGPSVNVQSACSTSLVAITQAYNTLMTYGCDMALAGGVSVSYPQKDGYLHQEGDIGSPDGHCRPFDADAQGTVFSNGVGVVLLKRLEDAIEDSDHIYAVVRGAALNNDGASKVSFAAPSSEGQAEVIAAAQALAEVEADSISFIETHGTGTALGDPIEVAGLTKAFGAQDVTEPYCALGSVKSNFGHLDSAAGVAAFIKTVLCLHHKKLVPTLHYQKPNSRLNFTGTPFYVNTEYKDWPNETGPRRAGVSGFGIGGTNAHIVLEEFEATTLDADRDQKPDQKNRPELLLFSAKTKPALNDLLIQYSKDAGDWQSHDLADIAYTLRQGRDSFSHKAVVLASSFAEVKNRVLDRDKIHFSQVKSCVSKGNLVFMFPGGGAQYVNMAADLYASEPLIRQVVDEGIGLLKSRHGIDLAPVWFSNEVEANSSEDLFLRPSYQLPAIFILEVALARWWIAAGINPSSLVGHSLGENTAACIAGVMSFEDCLGLVALRGQLFETVVPGGMLSVAASVDEIEKIVDTKATKSVSIATINAPSICTLSGSYDDLDRVKVALDGGGIEVQEIPINIAAHSPLLDPILEEFRHYLDSITLSPPAIPLMSNYTGEWMTDEQACSSSYWVDHLRNTVKFSDCVSSLLDDSESVFLEVGPGKTLSALVRLHSPDRSAAIVSSLRHKQECCNDNDYLKMSAGRLWCAGVEVNWHQIDPDGKSGRRVSIPGYQFQRKPFLIVPSRDAFFTSESPPGTLKPLQSNSSVAPVEHPDANISIEQTDALIETHKLPQGRGAMPTIDRQDFIQNKLTSIIEEMSGLEREDIEPKTTFLEMGFDSLFLTQANLKFRKEFGVKITFRQLFEDAPCVSALATYIDEQLPEDALQDRMQALIEPVNPASLGGVEQSQSPLTGQPGFQSSMNGNDLQQVLALQLQASNAIISLLTGGAEQVQNNAYNGMAEKAATAEASQQVAIKPVVTNADTSSDDELVAKGFGPYRPLVTSSGELGDDARSALHQFTEAYSARTAKSKQLASDQRSVLSDARSISGFRIDWKEIVYQIAGAGSKGSRIWDIDGNEYLDVTSGFGCNIMGYSLAPVVDAIKAQADEGFELGTISPKAKEAAEIICQLTGMERVTFANTGSESLSAAVRAARTVTGKDKVAVFYDEYHGISDELLVNLQKGKNGKKRTVPTSPGIPQYLVENVLVLEWDDPNFMEVLRENADELAALIIEPVQNRNPSLQTHVHFEEVRKLTKQENIALIFDEMITGFRLHPGGAQAYFGVEADMCCYGKIVSAGMSLAVLAGRGEYLDCFDGGPWEFGDSSFPEAGVTFFGGTYTRHPLAIAGALAGLKLIQDLTVEDYEALNHRSDKLANQLNEMMVGAGFPARFENRGSIFNLKFNDENPFSRLIFPYLRHKGVLIYDRPFFLSMAHTDADLEQFREAVANCIDELQVSGIVPSATIDHYYGGSQKVPFSDAQQEVWLATLLGENASRAYNEQVIYSLDGVLDIDALRHAMQKVVYRHEGLRSTALIDGDGLEVHPSMVIPVSTFDLRNHNGIADSATVTNFYQEQIDQVFDIYNGPLVRVSIGRLGDLSSVLVVTAHHLVIDGWSIGVILDDLTGYYNSARKNERFGSVAQGQISGLNRLGIEEADSEEFQETEAYWLAQYEDSLPEPPSLPLDFPRPQVKSYNGHRITRTIDTQLYDAIVAHSNQYKCTLFTALFSAFSTWLNKVTGQSDLVIGVPIAGQALWGCPDAVGHMVSYLPFRVHVDSSKRYSDFLEDIRGYILDSNDHQNFTYGSLLKKLDIRRDLGQMPLTSVSFNVDQGMSGLDFGDVKGRYEVCPRNFVKYDLFFNIIDEGQGLSLEIDYNSDLFTENTANAWVDQFEQLLLGITKDSEQNLADIPFDINSSDQLITSQLGNMNWDFLDDVDTFPIAFS